MLYYSGDRAFVKRILAEGAEYLHGSRLRGPEEKTDDDGAVVIKAKITDRFQFVTKVSLKVDPGTKTIISCSCDCPDSKLGLCKHAAALILSLGEEVEPVSLKAAANKAKPKEKNQKSDIIDSLPQKPAEKPSPVVRNEPPQEESVFAPPGIEIRFGSLDGSGEPAFWTPNDTERMLHPNMGIIGTMGTGKTQFTKSVVCQLIRARRSNYGSGRLGILIFDYKGDYNETKTDFVEATGAKVLKPYLLPFNPLALVEPKTFKPLLPVHTANSIKDTLSKIYPLGPKQQQFLLDCILKAYSEKGIDPESPATWRRRPPTIENVYRIYMDAVGDKPTDSLGAALSKLHQFRLFDDSPFSSSSIRDIMDGVVVIDLSGYDPDIQSTVVAITLDQFYAQMLSMGSSATDGRYRELREMILVDEADNFMREDFPSLRRILKEGREFGVCTVLSTQSLSHFISGSDNYSRYILTWVVHAVSDLKRKDIEYIFKLPSKSAETDEIYSAVKGLTKHHSMVKISGEAPTALCDLPFWQLVRELQ